jgi:proteasome inhibitor subunit 1 (PI31)
MFATAWLRRLDCQTASLSASNTIHTFKMANPLSPEKLLEIIKSTITSPSSSGSSSPPDDVSTTSTLTNPTSLIALLVHAIHTSLGFRQVRPAPPTLDSDGATSQDPLERNKWPREWWERNSARGEESFSLEYRHEQSSLVFQVRIARLGGRTVVNAVAVEVRLSIHLLQRTVAIADTSLYIPFVRARAAF